MGDDPKYVAALEQLCDQFVAAMKPVVGDAAKERAVATQALEGYKAVRRAHGIWPEDEFASHFFLSDGVIDGTGKRRRKPPVHELGLDKAATARIADVFMELLGI